MVGSAMKRALQARGFDRLLTPSRQEVDFTRQAEVEAYIAAEKPDVVFVTAAKVGGILANDTYPADFARDNAAIALNSIDAAYRAGVQRLLFLGSTCIYPRMAPQPMSEDVLLTSELEKTNEAYALAKILGLKLCEYYRRQYGVCYHSAMPTNLYGLGDNYHPENSHVIPGLLRRFHEAKENGADEVVIWGTGKPRREFLYVDDLADALVHLLQLEDPPNWVNVGVGEDVSILELAQLVAKTVGFTGQITHDLSKPDGTPRKLTDPSRLFATGWRPTVKLEEGLAKAYADFLSSLETSSVRAV